MDNSKLDRCLKFSKVLRLYAILHDAAGFVRNLSKALDVPMIHHVKLIAVI